MNHGLSVRVGSFFVQSMPSTAAEFDGVLHIHAITRVREFDGCEQALMQRGFSGLDQLGGAFFATGLRDETPRDFPCRENGSGVDE